ncbi:hypothetical protein [Streptomyces sp. NPDC050560]|uniref:hypothetical protein n=1 Tax=Streptomyces sp. NPDC050560 TaxID=3365630 RepID=UPI00378C5B6D
MPRPTAAQIAYGLSTVVLATVAMLLLSQTTSGAGVVVVALVALALGVVVAVAVRMPRHARRLAQERPLPAAVPAQRTAPRHLTGHGVSDSARGHSSR